MSYTYQDESVDAYLEIAEQYSEYFSDNIYELGSPDFSSYYIYNVDKKGRPELLINAGTCEADSYGLMLGYDDEGVSEIGKFNINHGGIYGNVDFSQYEKQPLSATFTYF